MFRAEPDLLVFIKSQQKGAAVREAIAVVCRLKPNLQIVRAILRGVYYSGSKVGVTVLSVFLDR